MATAISIVTGFLGSGKTTLLRHTLERGLDGQRVALIVNEIGAVGFDGHVVQELNVTRMIELTNGCICCSIGADFLVAVEEIIDLAAPELIIVETTGLAEPSSLIRQIHASDLPLDAIITVVDAANIAHTLELSPVVEWQLRAVDFLVLNKCDLVTPAQQEQTRRLLREHNPRAALFEATHGQVPTEALFGRVRANRLLADAVDRPPPAAHTHLQAEHIGTFLWRSTAPLARERCEATLAALPPQVYRAKGYVHCTDAPWPSLVNVVCGRVDYEATRFRDPPADLNQLVFIGSDLELLTADLCDRLDACADTPERAHDWHLRRGAD